MTKANDTTKVQFFGFVDNAQNITSGNPVHVVVEGIVGGFTGLTNGQYVYMSDTAGAISHTPSTTFVSRVGIAISTTEVLIFQKTIKQVSGGISSASSTSDVTTTVTLGFRPRVVFCNSVVMGNPTSAANKFICNGAWSDSTTQGWTGMGMDFVGYQISGDVAECPTAPTDGRVKIVIQNITDTSFDVFIDRTGTSVSWAYITYLALAE